uniref:Spaetzle domain-containing protein n=1 Tax=Graphocephala atropunctata TaxID=36148 RepID=A0A1B6LVD8_9HEMI
MAMFRAIVLLMAVTTSRAARGGSDSHCLNLPKINRNLRDVFCDQPLYANIIQRNEFTEMLDNICVTYFPLPDDPNTYHIYISRTYCDGSHAVRSYYQVDVEPGMVMAGNPDVTYLYTYFAYAGCSTDLIYRCTLFGEADAEDPYVYGISPICNPIGLSCLRKVQEILEENGLGDLEFYVLPQKLPYRCISQRACVVPSNNNQFYKSVGLPGPINPL